MKSCLAPLYCLLACLSAPLAGAQTFIDVALDVGLVSTHEVAEICFPPIGSGSAWADFDNDGDLDLYVTNHGGPNTLYRNDGVSGDGLPIYTDVAGALSVDLMTEISHGAVFVDYDNDGDQDLYVTNWQGNSFFENQLVETGSVVFADISVSSGLVDFGRAITAGWADFDSDGLLDVYLAKHKECSDFNNARDSLYRNNGDGTFSEVNAMLCGGGMNDCEQLHGLGFAPGWVDYDNDGDVDLYVANDDIDRIHYPNVLWRNDGSDGNGGWLFTDVSAFSGADIDLNAMGLGVGDYDNDGWLDLACSNIGANYLLRNRGDGTFDDVSSAAGIERAQLPNGLSHAITWGTAFFDYDLDTHLDLFFVGGRINDLPDRADAFFINNTDGTFTEISDAAGLNSEGRGRAASMADFDDDGFVDLFIGNWGEPPHLMRNTMPDLGNPGRWLKITLEGTVSNRDGIGARLILDTPDGTSQIREISSGSTHGGGDQRVAHFGLRNSPSGDLQVRWPSGGMQRISGLRADTRLHLREGFSLTTVGDTVAGQSTAFFATDGTPNNMIALVSAIAPGSSPVPNCPGVFLGLANPKLEGFGPADADGNRMRPLDIPIVASGRTGYFQAVDRATCRVSNLLEIAFE